MRASFNRLNSVFENTTNSYKFFWWLSIIEICNQNNSDIISFCRHLLNNDLRKPLENYYNLFKCSNNELNNLSQEGFVQKMDNFYLPQFELAKNMGFGVGWNLD